MRGFIPSMLAALAALVSCSGYAARTGVIGNALTTNVRPYATIQAAADLSLFAHGKLPLSAKTDVMTDEASLSFDYAMFADAQKGPAERFALAAIVRINESRAWRFQPGAEAVRGTFGSNVPGPVGVSWSGLLLRASAENDWPSDMLRANNVAASDLWLAARWAGNLNAETRLVVEYREPWPVDVSPESVENIHFLSDAARRRFDEFTLRARAAFSVSAEKGDFNIADAPSSPEFALPRSRPDATRLVGRVVSSGHDG